MAEVPEHIAVGVSPRLGWHFVILQVFICVVGAAVGGYIGCLLALRHHF